MAALTGNIAALLYTRESVDLGGLARLAGSCFGPTRRLLRLGGLVQGAVLYREIYRTLETIPRVRSKV